MKLFKKLRALFRTDALQFVRLGLQQAPAGADRTRFLKLESVLTSSAP